MPDALVCAVIHVHEQRFPVSGKCCLIYRKSMILGSNITTGSTGVHDRLIVTSMTVF